MKGLCNALCEAGQPRVRSSTERELTGSTATRMVASRETMNDTTLRLTMTSHCSRSGFPIQQTLGWALEDLCLGFLHGFAAVVSVSSNSSGLADVGVLMGVAAVCSGPLSFPDVVGQLTQGPLARGIPTFSLRIPRSVVAEIIRSAHWNVESRMAGVEYGSSNSCDCSCSW